MAARRCHWVSAYVRIRLAAILDLTPQPGAGKVIGSGGERSRARTTAWTL